MIPVPIVTGTCWTHSWTVSDFLFVDVVVVVTVVCVVHVTTTGVAVTVCHVLMDHVTSTQVSTTPVIIWPVAIGLRSIIEVTWIITKPLCSESTVPSRLICPVYRLRLTVLLFNQNTPLLCVNNVCVWVTKSPSLRRSHSKVTWSPITNQVVSEATIELADPKNWEILSHLLHSKNDKNKIQIKTIPQGKLRFDHLATWRVEKSEVMIKIYRIKHYIDCKKKVLVFNNKKPTFYTILVKLVSI